MKEVANGSCSSRRWTLVRVSLMEEALLDSKWWIVGRRSGGFLAGEVAFAI